jgi:preprotein translocase subunit SecG
MAPPEFAQGRMLKRYAWTRIDTWRQYSVVTYFYIAQIILAVTIMVLVMLQAKDAGMGNVFGGGDMGVARTRRGVEKTLFNATIVLGTLFLLLSLVTVKISG